MYVNVGSFQSVNATVSLLRVRGDNNSGECCSPLLTCTDGPAVWLFWVKIARQPFCDRRLCDGAGTGVSVITAGPDVNTATEGVVVTLEDVSVSYNAASVSGQRDFYNS